ncbi:component of SCAR regulatory complex [Pelomyxa schiedti]|nr:component of SCAR regulatory complex [Pelomyxa schiedti]
MAADPSLEEFTAALTELNKNQEAIQQIVSFCKTSYTPGCDAEVFRSSKEYTANVLLNVAYHVQNVATKLTTCMQVQLAALDKLDVQVKTLTDHMQALHDFKGTEEFHAPEAARTYQRVPKVLKLEEAQLPEHAKPIPRNKRNSEDSAPPPPPPGRS